MKLSRFLVLVTTSVAMLVSASGQDLSAQKALNVDVAQTIAQGAITQCRSDGFRISVTVVDSSDILKAFLRDDGAVLRTVEVSRSKADQVITSGLPSGPTNLPAGISAPTPILPGMTNGMGGIPIKVGDELIGAVAVSGAKTGDQDAACAKAGLAKVADKLN